MARSHNKKPTNSKANNNHSKGPFKEIAKEPKVKTIIEDDEDMNSGFSNYLRSGDGMEMMKLFIIGNTMIVLVTFAWPHIQETVAILKELFSGDF